MDVVIPGSKSIQNRFSNTAEGNASELRAHTHFYNLSHAIKGETVITGACAWYFEIIKTILFIKF